ncbi:DEHA2C13640p [Debaryomyces hansenii CBS767]|jgi:hypothetical protein|uniref:DEHA2C13640p n=1 Tax=Debaryomyces hansenii (strain ATCC 36239 / CBS 767 / BCRC 21394 / JCM 1990 / NBRC 0083 / IGC 2968) TaxID=284592 RepID=Q6BU48_DEBHA|nr:DEHA2C13640p [Debaryomyces hansenii CBS767]CAG86348.1 DEHA2C13640p [Debaryomyces hansenii CBS767]|eukprot:XP_458271.1 DEHA2C13640p [Debaryomyces hansenii CBS767]
MLNFSYSFNRAKRRSNDINDSSHPYSPKNIFHRRSDSIDDGYFPKNAEFQRKSEGSDTLNSDFREGSSYSAPDSPTGLNRYNNSANTSIDSQPVIDLNDVQKETSKFKRSLSYPSQSVYNGRNAGEYYIRGYSTGDHIPNYSSQARNSEYAYVLSGRDQISVMNKAGIPVHDLNVKSKKQQDLLHEPDKAKHLEPGDLDIDEILFAGQLAFEKDGSIKQRSATKIRFLPEASEELLSRLQLKNAGIIDVSGRNKKEEEDEEEEDDDDENEDNYNNVFDSKQIRDRRIKDGRKKMTFISKTISKLSPGF